MNRSDLIRELETFSAVAGGVVPSGPWAGDVEYDNYPEYADYGDHPDSGEDPPDRGLHRDRPV